MRRAILAALAELGPDQLADLGLHQLLGHRAHRLADHIGVLVAQHLPDDLLDRHPLGTGHRWRLLSSTPWNEPTILSATVAGTTSATSFRPNRTYTTLRDVTTGNGTGRVLEVLHPCGPLGPPHRCGHVLAVVAQSGAGRQSPRVRPAVGDHCDFVAGLVTAERDLLGVQQPFHLSGHGVEHRGGPRP